MNNYLSLINNKIQEEGFSQLSNREKITSLFDLLNETIYVDAASLGVIDFKEDTLYGTLCNLGSDENNDFNKLFKDVSNALINIIGFIQENEVTLTRKRGIGRNYTPVVSYYNDKVVDVQVLSNAKNLDISLFLIKLINKRFLDEKILYRR